MDSQIQRDSQHGFSLIELMIVMTVMLVLTAGIFSLMRGSIIISTATYELTEAQENLRFSQEFINRDLMNAGDGLKTIGTIRLPQAFVTNYLTLNPIVDAADNVPTGIINIGLLTSDNQVPANTAVIGRTANVRTGTDRHTMLEVDSSFVAITPTSIDSAGVVVTLPSGTTMSQFNVGEIYYFSSTAGATFATITAVDSTNRTLTFGVGGADSYGLNLVTNNNLKAICNSGGLSTSMQRMKIIHYFVDANNLLIRRVFGVRGAGYRDNVVSEHVLNVQFKYSLDTVDAFGNIVQPTDTLTTRTQRLGVRQVEVTVTVETPHALANGNTQLAMTTGTSVRNMQFRQAQQPTSTP